MYLNPTSDTYDNLLLAYKFMNEHLFGSILPICLITLQREKATLGYFCKNKFHRNDDSKKTTDEIALNPQYFRATGRDDIQVVSTLVHEMCHLWQHHYGNPGRSRYHNKEWANKMISVGLIPSSTGRPGGQTTGDRMTHYIKQNGEFTNAFRELKINNFALQWVESPSELSVLPVTPLNFGLSITTGGSEDPVESPIPRKIDKSKMKYSCPDCGLNAWAKSGANLICGDCNKGMIYAD